MNVIRELVTVLRYQVDKSGLDIYLQSAKKAGADVRKAIDEATNRAPRPAPRVPSAPSSPRPQTPPGVVNVPGLGPGTWKAVPGKTPVFIPHVSVTPTAPLGPPPIPPTPPVVPGAPGGAVPGGSNNSASIASVRSAVTGVGSQIRGLLQGAVAFLGVHEIFSMADEWATVNARIGLVTESAKEQKAVLQDIYGISQRTGQSYGETANLVFNMRQATEHAGISMKDTLRAAEAFNNALVVGGGTAANNKRASYELNHGLEIGHLGGMQLRSLRMEAPVAIRTLAEQLAGGDPEKLQQMATAGLLTTKAVVKALNDGFDELAVKAGKMPLTIGRGITMARNIIGKLINDIGQGSGAFQDFAHLIVEGTQNFSDAIRWAAREVGGFTNLLLAAGIAAGSLFGAEILAGIWKFTRAIAAGGLVALVAEAPFWLIAGALAAVGVAANDIYVWLKGGKSLLGDWIGSFKELSERIRTVINDYKALANIDPKTGRPIDPKGADAARQHLLGVSGDGAKSVGSWLNPLSDQNQNAFASIIGWNRMPKASLFGPGMFTPPGGVPASVVINAPVNAPVTVTTADNANAVGTATQRGIERATSRIGYGLGYANPTVEAN